MKQGRLRGKHVALAGSERDYSAVLILKLARASSVIGGNLRSEDFSTTPNGQEAL